MSWTEGSDHHRDVATIGGRMKLNLLKIVGKLMVGIVSDKVSKKNSP